MSERTGRAPAEFFSTTLESKLCSIYVDDTGSIFLHPRPMGKSTVERLRAEEHTRLKTEAVALFDLRRFASSIRLHNTYEGKRLQALDELAERYIPDIGEFPDPWNRPYRFDAEKGIVYSSGPDGTGSSEGNTLSVALKPAPADGDGPKLAPEAAARADLERLAAKVRIFMDMKKRLPRTLPAFENQERIGEADRVDPWGAYYLMDSGEAVLYSLGPDGRSIRFDKSHAPATDADDIVVRLKPGK